MKKLVVAPRREKKTWRVLWLSYGVALRPRQWTKNLVVFAAPLFAFNLTPASLANGLLAFALFSALASSFYLINDIADVEADRQHPTKCKRPIAARFVSIPSAIAIAAILMFSSLYISWSISWALGSILSIYALLQCAYNLKLKRIPIIDVIAIALGFVLRAGAGAVATKIVVSPWFLLCTAMLALFLAVEKRKAELRLLETYGGKTRAVLKRYSLPLLTRMEGVVTTGALMSYALWSSGPKVGGASTPWMMLTLPFVLYGIFRYQLLSDPRRDLEEEKLDLKHSIVSERPEEVLLTDQPILFTVLIWGFTCLGVLGLKHQGIIT